MKTAMQELMEWFYNRPEYDKSSEGYEIMVMAELLLQKEKEQICNSYVEGLEGLYMGAEEYYNKTYN
jgi:hypothetical protein